MIANLALVLRLQCTDEGVYYGEARLPRPFPGLRPQQHQQEEPKKAPTPSGVNRGQPTDPPLSPVVLTPPPLVSPHFHNTITPVSFVFVLLLYGVYVTRGLHPPDRQDRPRRQEGGVAHVLPPGGQGKGGGARQRPPGTGGSYP